jgi:hypothetical protein
MRRRSFEDVDVDVADVRADTLTRDHDTPQN